jgi:transcriptional regulator with XRE-family HTH domain
MSNERLRTAMLAQGLTVQTLAEKLNVGSKTVERWITQGVVPYSRHRYATATLLKVSLATLWPQTQTAEVAADLGTAEIVAVYPHRQVVPSDLWIKLYEQAQEKIDVLVYAGLNLSEDMRFHALLRSKAATAQIRLLLGDPDCPAVEQRGIDEGHRIMGGKIRNALVNYQPVIVSHPEVQVRLHDATLYNSIYRADDEMLVNTHVYGLGAYAAPVLHLRRLPGGSLFDTYAASVDYTWKRARAVAENDFEEGA